MTGGAAEEIARFREPLVYDDELGDERGLAFGRKKPEYATRTIGEPES
jgi:hypothetical protein